jgi:amino acid permease
MFDRGVAWRRGTLALVGTIIGAGVFGLPAMFSRVGFWPGTILFFLIALIITGAHLLYVDIILATKEKKRLAGYAKAELGQAGFWLASAVYPLQVVGINLAYILLGGYFLQVLASMVGLHDGRIFWQALFWIGGSLTVLYGLKVVAKVEVVGTWLLVVAMLLATALVARDIDPGQLLIANWRAFFVPFGIFLLSMSGLSVIPEIVEVTGRFRRQAMTAVAAGTIVAAMVSWIFGVVLYLASSDAVSGAILDPEQLMYLLPVAWRWLMPCVGFLAIATSYITTAQDLKETLHWDFSFSQNKAWFLALFTPFILLWLVRPDFLSVIDFVGSMFASLTAILIGCMAIHVYARQKTGHRFLRALVPSLVIFGFLIGMIQKILF